MEDLMPRNPGRPGAVGRPRIGVVIDFRVPEEVDQYVREAAESLGVSHDELYRELVMAGLDATATSDSGWQPR